MATRPFGVRELYGGSRFLAPLSESALLEAGRAAELRAGETVVEVACGTGAAAIFLSEEFHVYVRGLESEGELIGTARDRARRSPAARRLRFLAPEEAEGPVDVVCALRVPLHDAARLLRRGGRTLVGRYFALRAAADPAIGRHFPFGPDEPEGEILWRRTATPLEWERFLGPQERALRVYRRSRRGNSPSPFAREAEERIRAFRAHGSEVGYELVVTAPRP